MANNYNISTNVADLLGLAFGIRRVGRYQGLKSDNSAKSNELIYKDINVVANESEAERISSMGTPVIFPIKFKGGQYNYYDLDGNIQTKQMNDFELPVVALADFNRNKNIQQTAINGGYGKVIEMYGFNSWDLTIRGICINDSSHPTHQTALEQKEALLEFAELADSIEVVGQLFSMKRVYKIAIVDEAYPTIAGRENYFPFEFRCVSDTPVELIL